MSPSGDKIPFSSRLAYAAPAFALAVIGIPVYVYIPKFYTDIVGIPIAVVGSLLFGVRIFDAVTDPVMGIVSDKTRTPWGRRRPYVAVGALLLAATLYLLFNPPRDLPYPAVWLGICMYALFLFWTLVTVPYESMGPELTFEADERTALFGLRDGFLIAGTFVAAATPALIQNMGALTGSPPDERRKFFTMALIYGPLLIATCWWCVTALREKTARAVESVALQPAWRGLLANRPFIVLLSAYTISAVGNNLPATLILYYVEYVLESRHAEIFLLLYFVTGLAVLPAWVKLAKIIGKKRAWLLAMGINTGAFGGVFFLGAGDELLYGILVVLSGLGFGATLALPSAIQADVIDYDEWHTGLRREGLYMGAWSVAKKMAAALGIGLGLYVLGVAGYRPNGAQTEQVQLAIRVLYALVPSVCNLTAIAVAWGYPVSESDQRKLRQAIDRRSAGAPEADPVCPACFVN